jgi:hypothetical protein
MLLKTKPEMIPSGGHLVESHRFIEGMAEIMVVMPVIIKQIIDNSMK